MYGIVLSVLLGRVREVCIFVLCDKGSASVVCCVIECCVARFIIEGVRVSIV